MRLTTLKWDIFVRARQLLFSKNHIHAHLPCTLSPPVIVGAGRQSKPTHTTHIDAADAITGPGVQFTEDTPVARSPVLEIKVLEDKETIAHSSGSCASRGPQEVEGPRCQKDP